VAAKDFRKINFGYASAQQEGARSPNLLLKGYFDLHDVCQHAVDSDDFLILGYKGSGKSALAERLRLLYQNDSQVFITTINLEDFPYASFSQIIKGSEAPQAKYPAAWSWILLIYLLASLEKDAGLKVSDPQPLKETLASLREMGLLPIEGLPRLVRSTSERSFKLTIPKFFEGNWKTQDARLDIPSYVDNLKRLVIALRSESKHLIILDGLDEIVTSQAAQWDSLGALVFEVNRLNTLFAQNGLTAKILLLCRTDIFELLEGPNKNKIRQDSAIELDWYSDPSAPKRSLLVEIANLRAALAFRQPTDVIAEFFPRKLFGRSTARVLLDSTRHTPRDFLQLLKTIQSCCSNVKPDVNAVSNGVRKYSIEYFLPEMIDELQGYATAEEAKAFFHVVGSLRTRDFSTKQLNEAISNDPNGITVERADIILRALFECSGVGNVQHRTTGGRFLTFRYRNRHATFNPRERVLLHRGLWRALNLPVDPSWEDGFRSNDPQS
jgi:hypothetical protein